MASSDEEREEDASSSEQVEGGFKSEIRVCKMRKGRNMPTAADAASEELGFRFPVWRVRISFSLCHVSMVS